MQDTSSHMKVFVICYMIYGSNEKLYINKFESTLHFIAKSGMITSNNQRLANKGLWTPHDLTYAIRCLICYFELLEGVGYNFQDLDF